MQLIMRFRPVLFLAIVVTMLCNARCCRAEYAEQDVKYYTGKIDADRMRETTARLHYKVNCDAIIVATCGFAASDEGIVEAVYFINKILKGHEFLKPHIKRKDFRGGRGEESYVLVQYFEPWLKTKPLEVPDGPSLLFLKRPERDNGPLLLYDGLQPNDGIVYATKELVAQTANCVDRLEELLAYFKAKGFALKIRHNPPSTHYIIEETPDGAYASTGFMVFPLQLGEDDVRRAMDINVATYYNTHCRVAMFAPGVIGSPNATQATPFPERLTRHMKDESRIKSLFQQYRPKRGQLKK